MKLIDILLWLLVLSGVMAISILLSGERLLIVAILMVAIVLITVLYKTIIEKRIIDEQIKQLKDELETPRNK